MRHEFLCLCLRVMLRLSGWRDVDAKQTRSDVDEREI